MDSLVFEIFNIATGVAMLLLFLRFMMQLTQVDPYNPIVMSTLKATSVVDVFSRILPTVGQGRINLAALILIVLVRLIDISGTALLGGGVTFGPDVLVLRLVFTLLDDFLWMCKVLIYVSILASFILLFTQSPTPFVVLIMQMTEPIYGPFRRLLPDLGPIDLSPFIALVVIMVLRMLLSHSYSFLVMSLMS